MVREVLCECGVSRLWLERYSARVDYTGDASLQKSEVRSRRAPPRDGSQRLSNRLWRVYRRQYVGREELENPGMALVPQGVPCAEGMFAARGRGSSMEPKISDGAWCLFHSDVVGTRQDRIVLVEDRSKIGVHRYTLKKYHSRKIDSPDGSWVHGEILLLPLNSGHSPIRLESGGTYRICGWFVGSVSRIQCIEQPRYRYFAEE